MVHCGCEVLKALNKYTSSRLNSVVECAAVVRFIREKLPVHFCAETAMSPVRVWEAGPELITRIENARSQYLNIGKTSKSCSQRRFVLNEAKQHQKIKCPDSVEAYHGALSRLRPGSESRSGRYFLFYHFFTKKQGPFLSFIP